MKYTILLGCLFIFSITNSQKKAEEKKGLNFVTISLYSPTASLVPRWNIGFVKSFYNRFSLGSEFGYGSQKLK